MNEIQIKLTITADKAVIKLVESIVPIVEKITAAYKEAQGKPVEAPKAPEAENTPSEPEKPASAPQSAEDDDPGFSDCLPPIDASACLEAAKEAKLRGVAPTLIRQTISSFGGDTIKAVPEDRLSELFYALEALK